jgi:hypothetical protein
MKGMASTDLLLVTRRVAITEAKASSVLGRRLHHALALVVGIGDTRKRLRPLALWKPLAYVTGALELVVGHTLMYSFDCSCHSLFMVEGAGPANIRMLANRAKETVMPRMV